MRLECRPSELHAGEALLEPGGVSSRLGFQWVGVIVAFWHHLVATQCITTEVRKGPMGGLAWPCMSPRALVCKAAAEALASTAFQGRNHILLLTWPSLYLE